VFKKLFYFQEIAILMKMLKQQSWATTMIQVFHIRPFLLDSFYGNLKKSAKK